MPEFSFLSATRAGYNAIATSYADHFAGVLDANPWDKAMLIAFAELVGDSSGQPTLVLSRHS